MALERYVKPVDEKEEKRVKSKRKFWTKKKVLAVVLIAIILAGFYPIGHWPIWLLIYLSIIHGYNPIWVIQQQIRIQMEYKEALTRKIEVTIAKGDEVKKMMVSGLKETKALMEKYKNINPLFQKMLFAEEVIKIEEPNESEIDDFVRYRDNYVPDARFLIFQKPLPVWKDGRVLAVKILVVNDYGRDWPGITFEFHFVLLKPIRVNGWNPIKQKFIEVEVIFVGYDVAAHKTYNATVYGEGGGISIGLSNGTEIDINFPASVCKYFYDFDQGKTYTLIVPFAELLRDNYVIGVMPANMDIKVLEVGYVKP